VVEATLALAGPVAGPELVAADAFLAAPREARLAAAFAVAASAAAVAQSPEVDSVVDTAAGLAARAAVLAVSPVAVVARNAWPARVALPDGAVVAVSGLAVALPHGVAVVK